MISTDIYNKILIKDNHILTKRKRAIMISVILIITFVIMTILMIVTQMSEEERFEIVRQEENANGIIVVISSILAGIFYPLLLSTVISFVVRFFRNIDTFVKLALAFLPIYVLLLWIPCLWFSNVVIIWLIN